MIGLNGADMISTSSSRLKRKQHLEHLLRARNREGVQTWIEDDPNPVAVLFSLLFTQDDLLRWRVIELLGELIGKRVADDPEYVRDQIRRLFWSMNDESGNVMWHAPEVIGEILANAQELIKEYAAQLCSFLIEEPFERGTYWAVARLTAIHADPFEEHADAIAEGMANPDPAIRGYAIRALRELDFEIPEEVRICLQQGWAEFTVYNRESSQLKTVGVAEILMQN